MRNAVEVIYVLIIGYLALDVLGFLLWALSGQYPSDGFYLGTITAHVLGLVF